MINFFSSTKKGIILFEARIKKNVSLLYSGRQCIFLILRFWQVCSTNLSWCAKEGWILWLFLAEQPSYDVTLTPTLSWFVFLWHLVKPSHPCARLPRDLQLNKVQRFSVLKAIVFLETRQMEVYFVELRSTDENVIYNEQKAIASKYRARRL